MTTKTFLHFCHHRQPTHILLNKMHTTVQLGRDSQQCQRQRAAIRPQMLGIVEDDQGGPIAQGRDQGIAHRLPGPRPDSADEILLGDRFAHPVVLDDERFHELVEAGVEDAVGPAQWGLPPTVSDVRDEAKVALEYLFQVRAL